MGSGDKRRDNDITRINLPQGTESGSSTRDVNKICPSAFDVAINPPRVVPDGIVVSIDNDLLLIFGEKVGKLSRKQVELVVECASKGIRYTGSVLNREGGKVYARFKQIQ